MIGTGAGPDLPGRVLAIGAHPDDLELLCSGTLARFLDLGSAVELAVACRGDRGGSGGPDPALADRRRAEAEAAAGALGAPIRFLGFGDSDVYDSPESRARFVSLLRESRPDLVITHPPEDYHADHARVGELAGMACWLSASGGWVVGDRPPLGRPPVLVYMDTIAAVGFEPAHYVDISSAIDRKRRMLACHASQTSREDGGIHALAELMEVQSRLRGFQCGARFAEAFRPAPLWGRIRPGGLLP
ncbi:PIG-L deacetylase family protein [Tautonia plasticadhaerens]|uniref:4-oxalmesaconate hydratase n=1 Tax=Tautonia plasticadhaerens TaxID=2527974 RepID=A0A518HBR7_9BACT|nr:PIG-L family deacetylase [Tautonia plasticadhaerens]QDV38136.1 4-oxalmesaconate hydratase [Tautonia plasticadhaerens]